MTVTATQTFTQEDSRMSFYDADSNVVTHWYAAYVATDMLVSRSDTITKDGLTRTLVNVWKDQNSYDTFMADPVISGFMAFRTQYNTTNKITESTIILS